jgi:nucleoside-diphosphate-sugar epimerase
VRILLTGNRGFLGRYIEESLSGHEVLGWDAQDRRNVEDVGYLKATIDFFRPDVFIANAALVGGIDYINSHPYKILDSNQITTAVSVGMATYARQAGLLKKIVAVSSSMVYERATKFPLREEDVPNIPPPQSAYGFQKLAVEYYCRAAHQEFGLPYVIVRPFNVVGKGDKNGHVIPDLIRKIKAGGPVELIGDGNQIRCFTHAKDVARGIAWSCTSDVVNEDFNLANPSPISIRDLARAIAYKLGRDGTTLELVPGPVGPVDVRLRLPSVEKAERLLGWKPEIGLEQALDEMVEEAGK